MRRPRILVDVDGVLANFAGAICDELTASGFPRKVEEITSYNLAGCLGSAETAIVYARMARPGFARWLPWYPGAIEFLDALKALGEVVIVTAPYAPSETWVYDRETWLEPHELKTVHTHHKELVQGDFLIEDRPDTCVKWAQEHPQGAALLMDRPWNRRSVGVLRIHDYASAIAQIRQLHLGYGQ